MNGITFKVQEKKGGYVKLSALPANRAAVPHFGLVDAAIVTVFLLGISGLVYLLVLS